MSLRNGRPIDFDSFLLPRKVLHGSLCLKTQAGNTNAEKHGSVLIGLAVHIGPLLVYCAWLCLCDNTLPNITFGFLAVAFPTLIAMLAFEALQPSAQISSPSRADILEGAVLVFLTGVILGCATVTVCYFASAAIVGAENRSFDGWNITFATLLSDFCYYIYHRWLSHSATSSDGLRSFYRRAHSPHHGVAELDFWRGNTSSVWDTAVLGFQPPLGLLAAPLYKLSFEATLAVYFILLLLQATHHVNHTFNIGRLRFVLVDNHAHKLHHCPFGSNFNFGACFSMWDRNLGTFYENWSICANEAHSLKQTLPVRPALEESCVPGSRAATIMFIFAMFLLPPLLPLQPALAAALIVQISVVTARLYMH